MTVDFIKKISKAGSKEDEEKKKVRFESEEEKDNTFNPFNNMNSKVNTGESETFTNNSKNYDEI